MALGYILVLVEQEPGARCNGRELEADILGIIRGVCIFTMY